MKPLNIADIRKKHANAIKNTATGKALGRALDELQAMRDQLQAIRAGRCQSSNLLELVAEDRDPAKWAAMMLTKSMGGVTTVGEATDLIEGTLRHALRKMRELELSSPDQNEAQEIDP